MSETVKPKFNADAFKALRQSEAPTRLDPQAEENEFYDLLCDLGEFSDEDAFIFVKLRDHFHKAIKPRSNIERTWVNDVAYVTFEQKKLRAWKSDIIKSDCEIRLMSTFLELQEKGKIKKECDVADLAIKCVENREVGNKFLAKTVCAGTTIEKLIANAFCIRIDDLKTLDQMIADNQKMLIGIFREVELHRIAIARRLREESEICLAEESAIDKIGRSLSSDKIGTDMKPGVAGNSAESFVPARGPNLSPSVTLRSNNSEENEIAVDRCETKTAVGEMVETDITLAGAPAVPPSMPEENGVSVTPEIEDRVPISDAGSDTITGVIQPNR